eukprot:g74550.t1
MIEVWFTYRGYRFGTPKGVQCDICKIMDFSELHLFQNREVSRPIVTQLQTQFFYRPFSRMVLSSKLIKLGFFDSYPSYTVS